MAGKTADIDSLLLDTWGNGRWQTVQYILLTLQNLPWAFHLLGIIILGFTPKFVCVGPEEPMLEINATLSANNAGLVFDEQCSWLNFSSNISEPCSDYRFAQPKHMSIVSEWDLVCGKNYLADMSQTLLMVGITLGSAIFPPLSDHFGRKKTFLICHFFLLVSATAASFLPNMGWFLGSRAVLGAFLYGAGLVSYVMLLEIFPPVHRTNAALGNNVFWSLSVCALAAVGYLMRDYSWRHIQLAFAASSLITIFQFFLVDEPLRWLTLNGRYKEAIGLVKKATKLNKLGDEKRDAILCRYLSQDDSKANFPGTAIRLREKQPLTKGDASDGFLTSTDPEPENSTVDTSRIIDIFRHPVLRLRSLVICFVWITNSLTYYGLFMMSSAMAGDRHLNFFLNAVVEVPSCLINIPLMKRFGRRWCCITFHLFTAVCLILAVIVQTTAEGEAAYITVKIVTTLGKLGITSSFNTIYIYTPELFPTNIRASGLGMASVVSRIGGLIAPFSATVARSMPWLPGAIFGGFCLLASFLSTLLPETGNKDLPQTLADLEKKTTNPETVINAT